MKISKQDLFQIGNLVEFCEDVSISSMFGDINRIYKGTQGIITDKNVTNTTYEARYYKNIEVTYDNGKRIILIDYERYLIFKNDWNYVKLHYDNFKNILERCR